MEMGRPVGRLPIWNVPWRSVIVTIAAATVAIRTTAAVPWLSWGAVGGGAPLLP